MTNNRGQLFVTRIDDDYGMTKHETMQKVFVSPPFAFLYLWVMQKEGYGDTNKYKLKQNCCCCKTQHTVAFCLSLGIA
ncbi:hypothetical protein KHA80_10825 [Anaerobacillus sp. HL2]|nr:hypothetical protein KHA80_10825 [Anaerobacillus sp. HL2]